MLDITTGEVPSGGLDGGPEWPPIDGADLTYSPYPDYEANVPIDLAEFRQLVHVTAACGRYSSQGRCESGAEFRKILLCRREWCATCGAEWSDAHRRRFTAWLGKLQTFARLGYIVVTLPESHRPRTKAELTAVGALVVEVMKDFRFTRGLRRWHYFGDLWVALWQQLEPHMKKGDAQRKYGDWTPDQARAVGVTPTWHPHLNIVVDGEGVPRKREAFAEWALEMRTELSDKLGCEVNFHYEFAEAAAQKVHIGKYITRATFLDCEWDHRMARQIRGFDNAQIWGSRKSWDVEQVWQMSQVDDSGEPAEVTVAPELEKLVTGTCPCCDGDVKWFAIERTSAYRGRILDDYGGGYYRVQRDVFDRWDWTIAPDEVAEPPPSPGAELPVDGDVIMPDSCPASRA